MKKIPKFKTEKEEREFWDKNDSTEYLDWTKAKPVSFVNLKPTTEKITMRITSMMLAQIKMKANKVDVPYQSYIKQLLAKALKD